MKMMCPTMEIEEDEEDEEDSSVTKDSQASSEEVKGEDLLTPDMDVDSPTAVNEVPSPKI